MNASNMRTVYDATRKMISEMWFGTKKKPREPFKKCKNNKELYHLSRKIKAEQSRFLKRMIVIVDHSGKVRNEGQEYSIKSFPEMIENYLKALPPAESEEKSEVDKFYKHDFGVSFSQVLSALSHHNLEKNGIVIFCQNNRRIFPFHNVWPPTQQNLYSMYNDYILEKGHIFKNKENFLDIGCGTGIQSIIFNQNLNYENNTYCIDSNPNAIKSTDINRQVYNIYKNFKTQCLDLSEIVEKGFTSMALL